METVVEKVILIHSHTINPEDSKEIVCMKGRDVKENVHL